MIDLKRILFFEKICNNKNLMFILILRRLFVNVICGYCGVLNICIVVKNCIK